MEKMKEFKEIKDYEDNILNVGDIVYYVGKLGTYYYNTRFKILEIQKYKLICQCIMSELKNVKKNNKVMINSDDVILFNQEDILKRIEGGSYILKLNSGGLKNDI